MLVIIYAILDTNNVKDCYKIKLFSKREIAKKKFNL